MHRGTGSVALSLLPLRVRPIRSVRLVGVHVRQLPLREKRRSCSGTARRRRRVDVQHVGELGLWLLLLILIAVWLQWLQWLLLHLLRLLQLLELLHLERQRRRRRRVRIGLELLRDESQELVAEPRAQMHPRSVLGVLLLRGAVRAVQAGHACGPVERHRAGRACARGGATAGVRVGRVRRAQREVHGERGPRRVEL